MKSGEKNKYIIGAVIILVVVLVAVLLIKFTSKKTDSELVNENTESQVDTSKIGVVSEGEFAGQEVDMSNALLIEEVSVGTGTEVQEGDTIKIDYVGTLDNGSVFDDSTQRGEPLVFVVGKGQTIAGIDQGVLGMQAGGKRKLIIPASLGYGDTAQEGIPAGSTLHVEVTVLEIID